MVENKLPFAEGASRHRNPMFSGINYQFWKISTKIFIESIDQGIWNAIMNGPLIEVVPHQIITLKMQYVTVEPSRLPTNNVLVQSLNFQMNTTQ